MLVLMAFCLSVGTCFELDYGASIAGLLEKQRYVGHCMSRPAGRHTSDSHDAFFHHHPNRLLFADRMTKSVANLHCISDPSTPCHTLSRNEVITTLHWRTRMSGKPSDYTTIDTEWESFCPVPGDNIYEMAGHSTQFRIY